MTIDPYVYHIAFSRIRDMKYLGIDHSWSVFDEQTLVNLGIYFFLNGAQLGPENEVIEHLSIPAVQKALKIVAILKLRS